MDGSLVGAFMAVAGAAVAATAILSSFFIVPQRKVALITQFGKHVRTEAEPGIHMKVPFIQRVADKISTAEFQVDEELETKTSDDLFVKLPISIHYEIDNAPVFYFDKGDAVQLMKKNVSAAVREYTSGKSFQDLYRERQEIRLGVLEKVDDKVKQFGIKINDIVIDEPQATKEVKASFDRIRSSAADLETAKNEAAKQKTMMVAEAEAKRDRDILRGTGAAGYRQKIFDQYAQQIQALVDKGTPREEAVDFMKKIMELDTWREASEKGNMVIVVPTGSSPGMPGQGLSDLVTYNKVLEKMSARGKTAEGGAPAPSTMN